MAKDIWRVRWAIELDNLFGLRDSPTLRPRAIGRVTFGSDWLTHSRKKLDASLPTRLLMTLKLRGRGQADL